ncbi:MAG TPA: O-antigen ligase family protein [Blastocatellia bacterium]|nr:O-antigen ligase family protein [Blastocatellia bacterium]
MEFTPPLSRQEYLTEESETQETSFFHTLARRINGLVFVSLLLLLILVAVPYGTVEPWSEAFFECAIFGLTTLWILEGLIRGSWQFPERALFLPLLAVVGFALLQTIPFRSLPASTGMSDTVWYAISADPYNTLRFALKLTALLLAGLLLFSLIHNRTRLRIVIMTILCVALGSAIFGLLRQTVQRDVGGFILPYLPLGLGYGQFINSNHFAYLMELSLGLPLSLILTRSRARQRWLLFAGVATPLLLALILSNSRGGLLGLGCQVLFILFFSQPRNLGGEEKDAEISWFTRLSRTALFRWFLGGLLVVVLVVGISWVGGDPLLNKLGAVSGEVTAVGDATREGTRRLDIWRATWKLIQEHPLVGVGFGGYWIAIPQYHQASGRLIPQEAHNDYLEILASGGVIGVVLWGWFLVVFLRRAVQHLHSIISREQRAICIGALAGLFAVAVHSLVDFGLHLTINALLTTTLVVIALSNPISERVSIKHAFRVSPKV